MKAKHSVRWLTPMSDEAHKGVFSKDVHTAAGLGECAPRELLVPRLPAPSEMKAQMPLRGSNMKVLLEYVRTQPLVSPKIELSNQRTERVDVRVLPVIFRVKNSANKNLYSGELVDVYIGQ